MSVFKSVMSNKNLKGLINNRVDNGHVNTNIMAVNLLFSGKVRGGIKKGKMSMLCAPSQLGKSLIGLSTLASAQRDGMKCVVIDAEDSFDYELAEQFGIKTDKNSLMVFADSNIIDIKNFIALISKETPVEERHNVFVLFDSWGPLVTNVIIKKAEDGKETADMSLPRWKNELANILLSTKMTYFVVNHIMDAIGSFEEFAITGGKKVYYNCSSVVLGYSKAKDKDGSDITGAIITAKTHKSRECKEHNKLKYRIHHNGGLDPWFGLLELALEGGFVIKPTNGWYSRPCVEDDRKWREKDIYCSEFWVPIFKNTDLETFCNDSFQFERKAKLSAAEDFAAAFNK